MSTPPIMRKPPPGDPTPAANAAANANDPPPRPIRRPPLAKRLPGMSDERLLSLQRAATRISLDAEHPKQETAATALTLIDAEIGRRATGLADRGGQRLAAGRDADD